MQSDAGDRRRSRGYHVWKEGAAESETGKPVSPGARGDEEPSGSASTLRPLGELSMRPTDTAVCRISVSTERFGTRCTRVRYRPPALFRRKRSERFCIAVFPYCRIYGVLCFCVLNTPSADDAFCALGIGPRLTRLQNSVNTCIRSSVSTTTRRSVLPCLRFYRNTLPGERS